MGTAKSSPYSGGMALPIRAPTSVIAYHIGQIGVTTPKKYATFSGTDQSRFFS